MPVILAESDWAKWLDEELTTEEELLALLKPCPDDVLKIWPVSKAVGNVKNTGRSSRCRSDRSATAGEKSTLGACSSLTRAQCRQNSLGL